MGIKPIDIQVNISQLNQVARIHQHEQSHPVTQQARQAEHLVRETLQQDHQVDQSNQPTNDESKVRERKENPQRRFKHRNPKRRQQEQEAETSDSQDDEEKGHLVDTVR